VGGVVEFTVPVKWVRLPRTRQNGKGWLSFRGFNSSSCKLVWKYNQEVNREKSFSWSWIPCRFGLPKSMT